MKKVSKRAKWNDIVKVGDIVIILSTIIITIIFTILSTGQSIGSNQFSVVVKQGNSIISDITVDSEFKGVYDFEYNDGIGYLEIDHGRVRLLEMTKDKCPNQICSKLGWAKRLGDVLVCLPNRIVVEVTSDDTTKDETDAISF